MKNSKTLLGISLLGAILVSFGLILVKTDVTMAEDNHFYSEFNYVGIENVTENVYSISFWDKNTMFVTGGDDSIFHMSKIPVIIKSVHNAINGSISNILGGNHVNIGKSHNITVIGGKGIVKDGNTNATLFGGYENEIQYNTSLDTPTVLLGGKSNVVETGHDANVIVGGSSNTIRQGAQNVNILGGTDIFIDGNDVVAAGQKISGDVSDSFVFSDGIYNGIINLEGSGMFLLKVSNGVGFGTGTQDGNQGVASNGAISVGSININSVDCTESIPENVGLFGAWNGCLVGCTSGSAMVSKWEMLGYGDYCEQLCNSSDKCIAHPIDSWDIDYRSFCTAGFVDTSNASLCPGLSLEPYHNVIFETYLIDSEEECPSSSAVYNQCAFRCNEHAHLTGDKTGKMDGDTKCFNDCLLPWSESQYRGHNEIITGYSLTGVDCYDGAGVHDTCEPYRSNLMCVNGKRYEMENGIVTDTENTDYIYETCTLHSYTCDEEFNLTRENIVNDKKDFVEVWRYGNTNSLLSDFILNKIITPHSGYVQYSDIERNADEPTQEPGSMQMGVRGKYTLCIQYVPETTPANQYPGNEQACVESSPLPEQHRYKFEECNEGYELAEDGVCRKLCEYDGQEIKHGSGIVLYTGETAICPEMCSAKNFICYDGILYADLNLGTNGKFISGTALDSNIYNYTGCTLSGAVCDSGYYNIDEVTYQSMKDIGIFSSCQSSWVFNNQCATGNRYHLDACNEGYYMSGDTCLPDEIINQCEINSSNFEDLDMYFITNTSSIGHYTLMDRNLGASAYMGESGKTTGDWNGCYYQWGNNYGFPYEGNVKKISTNRVYTSTYGPSTYSSDTYIEIHDLPMDWSSPYNNNLWGETTNTNEARKGPCPSGYHVPSKSEFENLVNNYWKNSTNYTSNQGLQLAGDFLMPLARWRDSGSRMASQNAGLYWSSTWYSFANGYDDAYSLFFNDTSVGYSYQDRACAAPVRCFKNSPNQLLTIDSKGGTGALIILHGNEIMKLGAPHKGSETFGGWYWDEEYTLKAETGQTVSAPANLYAKWISNECDGALPSGNGVLTGSTTYPNGYTTTGWTYKVNGELGACEWRCSDGYIKGNNNTCVDNICANNHSDFKDLDMYFIINPTSIGHYTFMDRNLGASAYMGQPGKSSGDWYGCHYQWGNNYGFPNQGSIQKKNTNIRTEGYSWRNPYVSDIFLTTVTRPGASDWSTPNNYDLWGDTTNTLEARQGPCPEGYHVPTNGEFKDIINNYWKKSANYTSSNIATQRGLDSLMPFAGDRDPFTAGIGSQGSWGFYWSSSHRDYKDSNMLLFYNTTLSAHDSVSEPRSAGLSVRCFKNLKNSLLTIDSNGGTGALIIVHGDEITKLGTPHKGSETFGGWYWDSGYTSKAKTGDKISAPAYLYAKWGCAEGYVQSGDNCVVVYNCGGETPDGNNMSRGNFEAYSQTSWTYKAEGELGACEWRCHEGYIQSGNTCVEVNYECEGDDPIFDSEYVDLVKGATSEGQQRMLYRDLAEAQQYGCSYVCTGGLELLIKNGSRMCVQCDELEGKEYDESGNLVACSVVLDACPENYGYDMESGTCKVYGNCTFRGDPKNSVPFRSSIVDIEYSLPLGGGNIQWKCKNSVSEVVSHNCEYSCQEGYVCSRVGGSAPGCYSPSCHSSYAENREYATKISMKPSIHIESRKFLSSAENESEFDVQVENMSGCYYWCPEELLCKLRPDGTLAITANDIERYRKCYPTVEEKNANCGVSQGGGGFACNRNGASYTLIGYARHTYSSYLGDKDFETYPVIGGYEAHVDEGCFEGCTNDATDVITGPNGETICWKKCPSDQYFYYRGNLTNGGGCRSCNQWEKPNPDQTTWVHQNPVNCVDKCPEGRQWGMHYGVGGGEGCLLNELPASGCPEWTDYTVLEGDQIKCVHNL